ncbi:MAG: hypothetical protein KatS3mg113_0737 [Planctomycetaceae bacterium]|nr:MAG: hypothetical protein KatS3mg113_0737 [Planctomycetaceae bacterium]
MTLGQRECSSQEVRLESRSRAIRDVQKQFCGFPPMRSHTHFEILRPTIITP